MRFLIGTLLPGVIAWACIYGMLPDITWRNDALFALVMAANLAGFGEGYLRAMLDTHK